MSLISEFCSRRSPVTSKSKACWSNFWRPFLLTGTGMNDSLGRRPGRRVPVGPVGPISKCCSGAWYGELMTGLLMSVAVICCRAPLFTENVQPVTGRMLANSGEAKGAETRRRSPAARSPRRGPHGLAARRRLPRDALGGEVLLVGGAPRVPIKIPRRGWSCAERTDSPRQLRRSPDGSIETAFALVTGAGEVGRVVSGEG